MKKVLNLFKKIKGLITLKTRKRGWILDLRTGKRGWILGLRTEKKAGVC